MAAESAAGSGAAAEALLPPSFENGDGGGIGEIQATLTGLHGQAEASVFREAVSYVGWQSGGFLTKYENVVLFQVDRKKIATSLGGHGEHPSMTQCCQATGPVRMARDAGVFMIIQSGTAAVFVAQIEAQRLDQMQFGARIGAHADDVARIGRDFWLIQDNGKHGKLAEIGERCELKHAQSFSARAMTAT